MYEKVGSKGPATRETRGACGLTRPQVTGIKSVHHPSPSEGGDNEIIHNLWISDKKQRREEIIDSVGDQSESGKPPAARVRNDYNSNTGVTAGARFEGKQVQTLRFPAKPN